MVIFQIEKVADINFEVFDGLNLRSIFRNINNMLKLFQLSKIKNLNRCEIINFHVKKVTKVNFGDLSLKSFLVLQKITC